MTLANFDELLAKYAHLLIKKGLNVGTGDYVHINTDVNQIQLTHLLVKQAYEAGAANVAVDFSDDTLTRLKYEYESTESLCEVPDYAVAKAEYFLDKRAKRLALRSTDPNNLSGLDAQKISASQRALRSAIAHVSTAIQANEVSWLVAAGAAPAWAAVVFPDLGSSQEQVDALWEAIFKANRIYADDPIAAWDQHVATLDQKAKFLNDTQFDALHYTGPGTDLVLGLPKNHVWESAGSLNRKGEIFIANMPTEEVFTAPDFRRAEGYVSSSKPLAYGGTVIEGMKFTFKDGQIVEVSAEKGEETLKRLVEENEGARGLGEVALVAHKTPISQSGITFFNTLFDENASNHLAIGQAYATSVQGGTDMSQEELAQAGLNRSIVHVDFMIGNEHMNIDGIKADGTRVPIFRKGEWAY